MHDIHLIIQCSHKLEVVIRPVQTLTITGRKTEHHNRFIRVVCQFIVIIIITAIVTVVTAIHAISIIRIATVIIRHAVIIVVTTDISLFGEISTYRKSIRTSSAEPRVHK